MKGLLRKMKALLLMSSRRGRAEEPRMHGVRVWGNGREGSGLLMSTRHKKKILRSQHPSQFT